MPTLTVENYLKTILLLQSSLDDQGEPSSHKPVSTGKIATALGVAPGTVTAMVKNLEADGLVEYWPYAGVLLGPEGRDVALRILRRHRLVELFLVKTLGMDWSEVHDEAEDLEHAISDRVLDRLDVFLGHPATDPHGDPIPRASGKVPGMRPVQLAKKKPGDRCVLARLLDQSREFLDMAERNRLLPGAAILVTGRDIAADVVTIDVDGKRLALSTAVATKIAVSRAGTTPLPISKK